MADRYLVVDGNRKVVNVIIANSDFTMDGYTLILQDGGVAFATIGDTLTEDYSSVVIGSDPVPTIEETLGEVAAKVNLLAKALQYTPAVPAEIYSANSIDAGAVVGDLIQDFENNLVLTIAVDGKPWNVVAAPSEYLAALAGRVPAPASVTFRNGYLVLGFPASTKTLVIQTVSHPDVFQDLVPGQVIVVSEERYYLTDTSRILVSPGDEASGTLDAAIAAMNSAIGKVEERIEAMFDPVSDGDAVEEV